MKSNRWWIRGCSLRVLKRYLPKNNLVFWDGCGIHISDWEDRLEEVRELSPGDRIFNPYKNSWQKITEIEFVWDTGSRHPSRKKIANGIDMIDRYRYIGGFIIYDDLDDLIYHTPSDMAYRYPEYH